MRNPKYIYIIKTQRWVRQVKFAWLVLWEYENLKEAKEFAMNYEFGKVIEIVDWENIIEIINKDKIK